MNDPRIGIQTERFDQTGEQRRNVRMHQFQRAQPKQEQELVFTSLNTAIAARPGW